MQRPEGCAEAPPSVPPPPPPQSSVLTARHGSVDSTVPSGSVTSLTRKVASGGLGRQES